MFDRVPCPSDDASAAPFLAPWSAVGEGASDRFWLLALGAELNAVTGIVTGRHRQIPLDLLLDRLALRAARRGSWLEGRTVTDAELRDLLAFTPPDASPGLDGALHRFWRRLVTIDLGTPGGAADVRDAVGLLADPEQDPIAGLAGGIASVQSAHDRLEARALAAGDVALSLSLGFPRVVPLVALVATPEHLRLSAPGVCAAAPDLLLKAIPDVIALAGDLVQRAARIEAARPKLRAKARDAVVAAFLAHDVLAPSVHLSPRVAGSNQPLSDRAARRICDRLVDLGAVHELTGRATFRVYGL